MNILISSCFLLETRYDGKDQAKSEIKEFIKSLINEGHTVVPVCPEQLGGLTTPRVPAEIIGDKVITKNGNDVTKEFKFGTKQVLKLNDLYKFDIAILKDGSPSCGSSYIYDGTFTKRKIDDTGMLAKELSELGIKVYSELQIGALKQYIK